MHTLGSRGGAEGEWSERWGAGERRGGAAGRPRIVAEGDVLRVVHNMTGFYLLPSNIHDITSNLTNR